jgi:AcrR family transcriptional regulator
MAGYFISKTMETLNIFKVSIVSKPNFANQPESMDAKKDILEQAEVLFLKYGFRSVTMDDIAREMAVSKKTLYQHFKNKDQLVEDVVAHHTAKEQTMVAELQKESVNALDEMVRIAKLYAVELEKISPSAVYDLQKYYGKLWEETLKSQEEYDVAFIMDNLKRGRKEGFYRRNLDDEMVAKIFNKATLVIVNEMSNVNSKMSQKRMLKELHDYHMRSITTPEGLTEWKKLSTSI